MTATSTEIRDIDVAIHGDFKLSYDFAHDFTKIIATRLNPESSLLTWYDRTRNTCGPAEVCKTSPKADLVELERYGLSHGGRVKVKVNDGDYVFIYS